MHWKTKQKIGYAVVLAVFCAIVYIYVNKPGISILDGEAQQTKITQYFREVIPAEARITYLHLDGFGASRKFRYAIVSYMLPDDELSYTLSLYIDGRGGAFEPKGSPAYKTVYEDGILLADMDFRQIAANVRRIRDRFVEEEKDWMGLAEYGFRFDPDNRDFVHETKVYYEVGPNIVKWFFEYYLSVAPNESVTYMIRENGHGPLELKTE